jgi:hypothetical protein
MKTKAIPSSRRVMPIDIELGSQRLSARDSFAEADRDRARQLKQFRRTEPSSRAPNRQGYAGSSRKK